MSKKNKVKVKNCCSNCSHAKGYSGFDDFLCASYDCWQRAEQYDCKSFKPRKGTERKES